MKRPRPARWLGWWPVLAIWPAVVVAGLVVVRSAQVDPPAPDVVVANELVQRASAHWVGLTRADFPATAPDFTVVDAAGRVRVAHGMPVDSDLAAMRVRAAAFDIVVAGAPVGRLYVADPWLDRVRAAAEDRIRWAVCLLGLVGLIVTVWWWWLHRRIVRPFRDLEDFAEDVARGTLDAPLRMDRGHVFGAFTESFDILRTELARSRDRERTAREDRHTLVAQLGHDIRTPLASLEAGAELARLTAVARGEADLVARLDLILDKSHHIDHLVGELFRAGADELAALPITLTELPSTDLVAMFVRSDTAAALGTCDIVPAMVVGDPLRLQQVADNVLGNAAKYGRAPVTVTSVLVDDLLHVRLEDCGPGVPAGEVDQLCRKHFRGSNTAGRPGQGLGLYTSSWLMERMGGALSCENVGASGDSAARGFAVVLTLACAGRSTDPRESSSH